MGEPAYCAFQEGSLSDSPTQTVPFAPGQKHTFIGISCDKPPWGKLRTDQENDYGRRAVFMAGQERFMNYSEYETMLLAPRAFLEMYGDRCAVFGSSVSYEDVSALVPEFGTALQEAGDGS